MLSASEKELEFLKKSTEEIRSYITRYIGFIISLFGASGAISKYLFDQGSSPWTILVLLTLTLVLITLIFDIIFYKFKSHNRHVGYSQLLSQEVSHHNIEDVYEDKAYTYLDRFQKPTKDRFTSNKEFNLHSYEFIMSRYSAISQDTNSDKIANTCSKAKFVFKLPKDLSYSILHKEIGLKLEGLDVDFIRDIVIKLYGHGDNDSQSFIERIKRYKDNIIQLKYLKYLFTNLPKDKMTYRAKDLDPKYISNGWAYQKKVTQIGFIIVSIIYVSNILFSIANFRFASPTEISENFIKSALPLGCLFSSTFILGFWMHRYLTGLVDLMHYHHSIEYYCWTFFLYRIQFLNASGIVPVYFSRSFIRYVKSKALHSLGKRILDQNPNYDRDSIYARIEKYIEFLAQYKPLPEEMKILHEEHNKCFKILLEAN